MRSCPFASTLLSFVALVFVASPSPLFAEGDPFVRRIATSLFASAGELSPAAGAQTTCLLHTIECGETVNSTLSPTDCDLGEGNFVDFWTFAGTAGDHVTINGSSTQFDTVLALLDPTPELVASDDDSGPGVNSRIVWDLDVSGDWAIGIANFFPDEFGDYSLSLDCHRAQPPVEPFDCMADATTLCLANDRFRVTTTWRTVQGTSGDGMAVELTPDTGYFWFFAESNVEMVLKVLNACTFADRFWVFAGGLTNVEVEITVTDSETGAVKTYDNPLNTAFQPIQDTQAFATCP